MDPMDPIDPGRIRVHSKCSSSLGISWNGWWNIIAYPGEILSLRWIDEISETKFPRHTSGYKASRKRPSLEERNGDRPRSCYIPPMIHYGFNPGQDLVVLFLQLLTTVARAR